ncbi:MFS transporter [bacterium]|nr:MFS transporter [bacterium]
MYSNLVNDNVSKISKERAGLTSYQKFVVALLSFLQFTVILDFMILSPMAAILMPALKISPSQFGFVVSAYAFSAALSGAVTASFADRFDRKKILLWFYSGFIFGTFLCGIANSYLFLLVARIVTGSFGGVIASITMAMVADLFPFEQRGRVMGLVQTSFASSQIIGIPFALWLSNRSGWHMPFQFIAVISLLVLASIAYKLKPIITHITVSSDREVSSFLQMFFNSKYLRAFLMMALVNVGGFMFMPFLSAFNIRNLGISQNSLPMVYLASGISSIAAGILSGRASDSAGKFPVFLIGTIFSTITVAIYTNLNITSIFSTIIINSLLFVGISSKKVSGEALITSVPESTDRGWFMSVGSSVQQMSGGIGAIIAGSIVTERADGSLENFGIVGLLVIAANLITLAMMYNLNRDKFRIAKHQV